MSEQRATYVATGELVDHPRHYNVHPSGVECIDIVEHMGFNLGTAIKHLWRADEKGDALLDLRKALWYIERELEKRRRIEPLHVSSSVLERLRKTEARALAELNRRATVEQLMLDAAKAGTPITAAQVRAWALRLGTPEEV